MNKSILITGGAGFIGSHIVESFVNDGYKVVVVDNLVSGSMTNLDKVINDDKLIFCECDIRDCSHLEEIFAKYRPSIVSHHAAQKSVPFSVENPKYDIDVNGNGLLNLIQLSGKYKVDTIIYVSSGGALSKEILGNEKSCESDMPQLESPYAINKFAGEQYIKIYSKVYGYQYTILRYANVYGPRQIADGECGVIPIFVNNILADKDSLLMTYDDMPRGCTRDYVYISDIVKANHLAVNHPINDVVNIGSGVEMPILDIYEIIRKVFNSSREIYKVGPRAGDVKRSVLDSNKAKELLGWEQSVSLEEGVRKLRESYAG